jgi:hypothetical protein
MPSVYPFVFFQRPRRGRHPRVGFHVDSTALVNVGAALLRQGYDLGDVHLNYPPRPGEPEDALEVALDQFGPDDLIMTATRLELEPTLDCRKVVMMGRTPIERLIEAAWGRVLRRSERLQVVLQPEAARHFTPGFENRRNIEFNEREGAFYTGFPADVGFQSSKLRATAAYLLRKRALWPGGPGYLGFFGMDSTTALAFSQLLRHRYAELLQTEGFFMVELSGPLPGRVSDLRWALDWTSEIILRAPVDPTPREDSAQDPEQRPAA